MTPRPAGRAGFTLTEMVVVMWVLGIAAALGTQLLIAGSRAVALGESADTRAARRAELGRVFRADAARAEAATPDASRLILKLKGGAVVAYEWADDRLLRTEWTGDTEARQALLLSSERLRVEFPPPADGVITLRLVETTPNGTAWASDVSAALGGDLR